jgi:F-type H+-transporting ATPase subunit delta
MLLNEKNITVAEVETAYMLNDEQKNKLSKMLEAQFKKQIKIKEEINKNLLAGIKIKVNNQVIDYSVKNKVDSMREKLTTRR